VTPIDTATNTAGRNIKVGRTPSSIVITPDGKTLYAVGNTTLFPISTATNTVGKPIYVAARLGTNSTVAITPDGKTVYVGGVSLLNTGNYVVPVDTATGAAGKTIVVRGEPHSMAVTPDGKTLYVVCAGDAGNGVPQDVIPVSTATNEAGPAIRTGLQPLAIAISR
jgi:DNA-binding beta-propeller fold protein YncE